MQNSINLRGLNVSYTDIKTEGFNILMQALRGSPIERLHCFNCGITSIEIESVPPNNLRVLSLVGNNVQSEGFSRLLRSLRDSSIEELYCSNCYIESIEINTDLLPGSLKKLSLDWNRINTNGCRGIAKLLQEGDATLQRLSLGNNLIGDEGVAILVDVLKSNTSLKDLDLDSNHGISDIGRLLILKMLNDISSVKSMLHSNHTLRSIDLGKEMDGEIESYISKALRINETYECPKAAGREKVIQTQLHNKRRAKLVEIQGVVSQSVYGEINPPHLPEVLSLVGRRHVQEELYLALKASIAELLSTVNRKLYLQQRRARLAAELAEIDAELAAIEATEGDVDNGNKSLRKKRLRL